MPAPKQRNVLGGDLLTCSMSPRTGFFRDGCCNTAPEDVGQHTVCAVVTKEFLAFSVRAGNDLVTPRPEFNFAGLKPGDRWCVCANRWLQALRAGVAPPLVLEATHESLLASIPLEQLMPFAYIAPNARVN
jgi:hypothetical protein